jgi:hypothetical protein
MSSRTSAVGRRYAAVTTTKVRGKASPSTSRTPMPGHYAAGQKLAFAVRK